MKFLSLLIYGLFIMNADAHSYIIADSAHSKIKFEGKSAITMSYAFDGNSTLFVSLQNISVNAATREIKSVIKIDNGTITITPSEVYPESGPVDSVKTVAIQYIIQNVKHTEYRLIHDDSSTEGQDRVVKALIDLAASPKGIVKIDFYDPEGDDPFKN